MLCLLTFLFLNLQVDCNICGALNFPDPWGYPNTGINDWVDTIMHQVFLGVTKSLFTDVINDWLKSSRSYSVYVATINPRLLSIKDMSIDFCKAETVSPSGGGFGRYVSENYLAFARICKWVYSSMAIIRGEPAVQELISGFLAMVARIMVTGDITPSIADDTDRHVKLFLTMFHNFQKSHLNTTSSRQVGDDGNSQPQNVKPYWLSKYNYITLLNIPESMLRFGSLRLLFEGDGKGEGSLHALKDAISSFRGKWAYNAASRYYLKRSLREVLTTSLTTAKTDEGSLQSIESSNLVQVCSEIIGTTNGDSEESASSASDMRVSRRFRMLVTYPDRDSVVQYITNALPLSLAILEDGYACSLKNNQYAFLKIDSYVDTICGAAYFTWRVESDILTCQDGVGLVEMSVGYGILLPLQRTIAVTSCYYLVTSNWEELDENGTLGMPVVKGATY